MPDILDHPVRLAAVAAGRARVEADLLADEYPGDALLRLAANAIGAGAEALTAAWRELRPTLEDPDPS